MAVLKIKEEFKNQIIGFNHSAVPLGQRNDLHKLYDLAKSRNLTHLLVMFEEMPSEEKLMSEKAQIFNEKQVQKRANRNKDKINGGDKEK